MTATPQPIQNRPVIGPLVDVREDAEGYTLRADLPGVAETAVQLTVEDRTLILDADNDVPVPEGYQIVRQEIAPVRYRAVFEIPDRVDPGAIQSVLRNGVLIVTLPKREEVKPRRLTVTSG